MSHLVKIDNNKKGPEESWQLFTMAIGVAGISVFYKLPKINTDNNGETYFKYEKKERNTGSNTETK